MSQAIESIYTITVTALVSLDEMEGGDNDLVGVHEIGVAAQGHSPGDITAAILNAFHDNFGIENVDDLGIEVRDSMGQVIGEEEDSQAPDDIIVWGPG